MAILGLLLESPSPRPRTRPASHSVSTCVSRRKRWLPPPGNGYAAGVCPGVSMVEVTSRTIGRRFLLRPETTLNERVVGVLARAQQYAGLEIYGVNSNYRDVVAKLAELGAHH